MADEYIRLCDYGLASPINKAKAQAGTYHIIAPGNNFYIINKSFREVFYGKSFGEIFKGIY